MPPTADPTLQSIPEYALKHAPIVWLHKDDEFYPSHPVEHLQHVSPQTFAGVHVDVPADVKNKVKMLAHPDVNKGDVFLTLDVRCVPLVRLPLRVDPGDRTWITMPICVSALSDLRSD
jgi:hypothetical protein